MQSMHNSPELWTKDKLIFWGSLWYPDIYLGSPSILLPFLFFWLGNTQMVKLSITRKEIKMKGTGGGNNKVNGMQQKVEILYCPLSAMEFSIRMP